MNKTDTLIIDSKDRTSSSTSSTDFTIKLPMANKPVKRYEFTRFVIPLLMDNVTTSNYGYEIDDVAGTIATGLYDVYSLADWMTANIAGYTVTYETNGRFKITNDTSTNFKWEPLTCYTLLGFTSLSYTGASSYTAENMPILMPIKYITVHSQFLYSRGKVHNNHTDNRSALIALIPINMSLGNLLVYLPYSPLIWEVDNTNNDIVDFYLKDDQNRSIDIQGKSVLMEIIRYS